MLIRKPGACPVAFLSDVMSRTPEPMAVLRAHRRIGCRVLTACRVRTRFAVSHGQWSLYE